MRISADAVRTIAGMLPQFGVTSFLATPLVRDVETTQQTMRNIREAKGCRGADIFGIFPYMPYRNRSIAYYADHTPPTLSTPWRFVITTFPT